MFKAVWNQLPVNVAPVRSLADAAYCGEACLAAARLHGATSFHAIKSNAVQVPHPTTSYHKLVHFARHFHRRFAALTAKRNHAETVFSMIGNLLGYRLRRQKNVSRKNEVRCKLAMFNVYRLAMTQEFWS